MELSDDVNTTSIIFRTQTWPHSRLDCPLLYHPSNPPPPPCSHCYCFVCDIPFHLCENPSFHEMADGRSDDWTRLKRRRSALSNTWLDIPNLVNLIVSLSVDESVLRQEKNVFSSQTNGNTIVIDDPDSGSSRRVHRQVASAALDISNANPNAERRKGAKDTKTRSPTSVTSSLSVSHTVLETK